ncbi:MAG TPA: c(7)-type cytochrome triheme domain-containing protein [Pelomicrobium sp.]|nr:c(7)-type cytochrome triheme domain-containing protein [Pelomicrobium sp.]
MATLAYAAGDSPEAGRPVYDAACAGCHGTGVMGAPKYGDKAQWAPRLEKGIEALYASAIKGTAKGMPPKGGRSDLSDEKVRAAVNYMLVAVGPGGGLAKAPPPAKPDPAPARAAPPKETAPAAPATQEAAVAPAPTPAKVAAAAVSNAQDAADVNAFNRLLKSAGNYNRPAAESGIHDPANDGTLLLQPPARAFATLPKSPAGNHVDWVKALEAGKINPRWDRADPKAQPVVMDLNIVREVKGSMPDVVYPHKQHTEWLDCSNCHPKIFVPQKGANQISMAAILLGQKCGVCHGKVAFPVSECRLCHSKKKNQPTATPVAGQTK